MYKIPEQDAWRAMIARCYQKKNPRYLDYGGRGIKVCRRWRISFDNFLRDMGSRPSKKHSLDRVDNDGDYKPSNCRWALPKEQLRNTRVSVKVTYKGKTLDVYAWSVITGITSHSIKARLLRGWSVEDTLTRPKGYRPKTRAVLYPFKGKKLSLSNISQLCGIKESTLYMRLANGWSMKDATTRPVQVHRR